MTAQQTFIAILKAYCCLMILILPRSFARGGYVLSPIAMAASAALQCYSAVKLVRVANHFGIMSYGLLAFKVFGQKGKVALDIMIALTQFTFTISFVSFITAAWTESIKGLFDANIPVLGVAAFLMCILVPISWVRDITKFSWTFLFGNIMILLNIIVITIYLSIRMADKGLAKGIEVVNSKEYWTMIGFSCYCYEGIGMILPIMNICECPEKFEKIIVAAFIFLTCTYVLFSNFCYLAIGEDMTEPFVVQQLDPPPHKSLPVILLKVLYSFNLVCSYAIMIYPCNNILEDWTLKKLNPKSENSDEQNDKNAWTKYILANFQRFINCLLATICAVVIGKALDKVLAVMGAMLCAPLAITFPCLLHLYTVAKTNREKIIDIILVVISIGILFMSTYQSILNWNVDEEKAAAKAATKAAEAAGTVDTPKF